MPCIDIDCGKKRHASWDNQQYRCPALTLTLLKCLPACTDSWDEDCGSVGISRKVALIGKWRKRCWEQGPAFSCDVTLSFLFPLLSFHAMTVKWSWGLCIERGV
eukprot:1146700-Pelagomonas_calceolata.AAC.6